MSREFKPSEFSAGRPDETVLKLRYICKAAELVEAEAKRGALPSWVVNTIAQAAHLMGMAASYAKFAREKRGDKTPSKRKKR